jgi:L-fuculose-phosphate aldolase
MEQNTTPHAGQAREATETGTGTRGAAKAEETTPRAVANSAEATALRDEIIGVGRKLWERQYVDGNGGNISVRLGPGCVLCTPTMMSKRDLVPADICLSDLDGNILAGERLRTSELLLHLEIYKVNPRARAVVHCHPPYATAFAITGSTPPIGLIPEYEIFIGPAAVARYETPGTQAFAETVLPFVQDHNTILLSNHGIVCWADTVTHAEWLVEILETYCKTVLIAQQIGKPLNHIPECKLQEILALKRRLGFPDARISDAGGPVGAAPRHGVKEQYTRLDDLVEQVTARLQGRS